MSNLTDFSPEITKILKKPAVSSKEFALLTGQHPVTIRRKLAAGAIPSVRHGNGPHLIPHSVVLRLIGINEAGGDGDAG